MPEMGSRSSMSMTRSAKSMGMPSRRPRMATRPGTPIATARGKVGSGFKLAPPQGGSGAGRTLLCRVQAAVVPPSLFETPTADLSVDDSAQLGEDHRQPDHLA